MTVFKKLSIWKVLKIILLNPWKSLIEYWPEYLIQRHIRAKQIDSLNKPLF